MSAQSAEPSAISLPAAPPAHPVWGNLADLRRGWLEGLTRYAREYGDVVPMRLGPRRALLLSRADLVEQVLVSQARSFGKSPALRNARRLLGGGLLTSEGDRWRRQRRLLQPAFQRQRVAAYGESMVRQSERLTERWRDGDRRDLHAEMMRLTLGIVARALFDVDVEREAAAVGAALEVTLARFGARMNSALLLLRDDLPIPGNLGYLRAAHQLDQIVYGIIEQRRREGEQRDDLLSALLRIRDDDGSGMTDRQIRNELMTLFLAGHETTAIALSWSWYLLAQHPAVEQKLVDELRSVLAGRAPTVTDLPALPYAEQVVLETLRLYPPAWVVGREARESCEIGGYRVPRGTIVLLSQWVLQRDPRYFEHAEAFEPQRWADGLARRLPRYAYFPFSAGPRTCIGNHFALQEAILVLATLVPRFHFTLQPGAQVTPWPTITLRPRPGVPVVVEQRT
jgi:cytochrome P450